MQKYPAEGKRNVLRKKTQRNENRYPTPHHFQIPIRLLRTKGTEKQNRKTKLRI